MQVNKADLQQVRTIKSVMNKLMGRVGKIKQVCLACSCCLLAILGLHCCIVQPYDTPFPWCAHPTGRWPWQVPATLHSSLIL